jgi:hypothetical protein
MGKLFNRLLQKRLDIFLENNNLLSPNQTGFRKGFRTTDNIFILKTVINKYLNRRNGKVFVCFVDFKKVFDSVWRQALLFKLLDKGIGRNFYKIIKHIYSNTKYSYKSSNFYSNPFMANSGVKQGDNLSPTLFNIFIDDFAKYLDKNLTDPISLNNIEINHLLYADDLVLMVQSPVSFQHCLNALQNFCKDWKLDINPNKTKVIVFCKKRSQITHFASIIVIILLKLQTSTNI